MKENERFPLSWELRMPKMGESITEGTIISWLINEGDSFEEGDIILEVATDKVDNEVPAPKSGTLIQTLFKEKDVVPVGEIIAIFESSEDITSDKKDVLPSQSEVSKEKTKQTSKKQEMTKASLKQKTSTSFSPDSYRDSTSNHFFSPLILKIAKEQHISYEELARIPATGHEGRLRKSDVFNYIEEGRPYKFAQPVMQDPTAYRIPQLTFDKGKDKVIEMDRMRQMIADHKVYSKHTSPHVTAYVEADLTNMVNWRNANKKAF